MIGWSLPGTQFARAWRKPDHPNGIRNSDRKMFLRVLPPSTWLKNMVKCVRYEDENLAGSLTTHACSDNEDRFSDTVLLSPPRVGRMARKSLPAISFFSLRSAESGMRWGGEAPGNLKLIMHQNMHRSGSCCADWFCCLQVGHWCRPAGEPDERGNFSICWLT